MKKVTKEQYEADYCKRHKTTVKDLNARGFVPVPCRCRQMACKGWRMGQPKKK